jgi:hypothetical protein
MSHFQESGSGSGEIVSTNTTTTGVREQLASTKESYNDALRELRQDRISWKSEKRELRDLKKSWGHDQQPIPKELQVKHLMEENKRHESHFNKYADQIQGLREMVMTSRLENQGLRGQLANFKANNQATVIQDLEEEVAKWELLYIESAELGAARIKNEPFGARVGETPNFLVWQQRDRQFGLNHYSL